MALFYALGVTTLLYIAVAWVAVNRTPIDGIAESSAPMTFIFSNLSDAPAYWVSLVAMIAVLNGALVQVIMASRVLYGLAMQKFIYNGFSKVHEHRQTPIRATVFVISCVFIAAVLLPLATLAKATSFFLLIVFTLVNISLIRLKIDDAQHGQAFEVPIIVPWLGAIGSALMACFSFYQLAT